MNYRLIFLSFIILAIIFSPLKSFGETQFQSASILSSLESILQSLQSSISNLFSQITSQKQLAQVVPATITANTCEQQDVQNAVNSAKDGDMVLIPFGTCTWTKTVVIGDPADPGNSSKGKYLTLRGAGMDKTIIIVNVPITNDNLPSAFWMSQAIHVQAKSGGLARVTGMTIDDTARSAVGGYNKGLITVYGNSNTWRIDNMHILASTTAGLFVYAQGGVVDHNIFDMYGWHYGIYGFNPGSTNYGDEAWAEPNYAGTEKPFFIEDNVFNGKTMNTIGHDGWTGERVVFRYNTLRNANFANHGTESSGRWRSARFSEVYNNTFSYDFYDYYACHSLGLRGGNGYYFNNTVTSPCTASYNIPVSYSRGVSSYEPWGQANALNPWDSNDNNIYVSGVHNGSTNSATLTDSTKNWTANQWSGYILRNTKKGFASEISSNTENSITINNAAAGQGSALQRLFDPDDTYEIRKVLAFLDQTGRGQGDLVGTLSDRYTPINTISNSPAWPNQISEPSYAWNNKHNGAPLIFKSANSVLLENRDFYNAVKSNYTPYTYPHPLTIETIPSDITPPQNPSGVVVN